jgi:hypothetical protein
MALSANGQVVTIAMNTLCCIQYHIYNAIHVQLYETSFQLSSCQIFTHIPML